MSFWNELSTPVKAVAIVGAILIVLSGGFLLFSGGGAEESGVRGLPPPGAAPQ